MTYKQTLFFVSNCLSLVQYPERRKEVAELISSGLVNWDHVVKFSSNQMVVPALYYNLKQADLIGLLPEDLTYYLEEISHSNQQRNEALLLQANHLVALLEKQNIAPIFLKGMAHIMENLYLNIGERMVGDIDFLVSQDQVDIVVELLKKEGYRRFKDDDLIRTPRHYSRLVHKDFIGAIEIHWKVLNYKQANKLPANLLLTHKQKVSNFYVPSYAHQALHNLLNVQINDSAYKTGILPLRHFYDGFLLSSKPEVATTLKEYQHNYFLKNLYLKCLHKLFRPKETLYKNSLLLQILMLRYVFSTNEKLYKLERNVSYFSFRLYNYLLQIVLVVINKNKRQHIYKSLKTKGWLKRHLNSYKKRKG